jgi:hypothetical protein
MGVCRTVKPQYQGFGTVARGKKKPVLLPNTLQLNYNRYCTIVIITFI